MSLDRPKPRVLVTSAAGHTGAAAVHSLLKRGFPVRAFVRRNDARAEALRRAGAEIFVGDLFDYRDLQRALIDVKRAYHCPPYAPNLLHGTMLFALAAEEAKLEVVALMSGWNPHPTHPVALTREHWIANNVYRWMPSVDVIYINPGIFAFMYFFGLPAAVHFGMLMLPFGEGLNAPPSNEDIAAVAAGVLAEPAAHIGKSYRPTGPKLISGHDCAEVLGRVLGRKVRYRDVPTKMFVKAAKAQGLSNFVIAGVRHYAEELRGGTYAVGAPTDHVEQVCGRPAEDFEITVGRFVEHPESIWPGLKIGSKLGAFWFMLKTMLTRAPDLDRWESERGHPMLKDPVLAQDSPVWLASAEREQLLIQPPIGLADSENETADVTIAPTPAPDRDLPTTPTPPTKQRR